MALIKCSECGKDISDKAAACPGCGAPIAAGSTAPLRQESPSHVKVTRTGAKWEGLGFILIIGGMLVAIAASAPLSTAGGVAIAVGIVLFIIGRFK